MKRGTRPGLLQKTAALLLAALLSAGTLPPLPAMAAGTPIPVAIEADKFDSTIVSSDTAAKTLILTTGSAGLDNNKYLMVTPEENTQAGTAVRRNRMLLSTSGFSTYFQMQITNSDGNPADGLCFIVYRADTDATQTGATGEGLGYQNIGNSIGIELDTYVNSNQGDPSSAHVAIDTNGSVAHSSTAGAPNTANLGPTDDGTSNIAHTYSGMVNQLLHVWVDYDGTSGYATVVYGTNATRTSSSNYAFKRNVGTALVGKNVYVGFSASTGGSKEKNDVLKWYFSNNYVSGGLSSAAGAYAQGASTGAITFNGTGTGSATDPTKASITLYNTSGTAMANQDVRVAIDGGTQTTYNTGASGTYDLTLPTGLSTGSHTVTITSDDGGVVKAASFTVQAPTISGQPSSTTKTVGQTATFSVTASANGTLAYQWQKSTDGGSTYTDIASATASSYTTDTLGGSDTGSKYKCVVKNTTNNTSTTTSAATLTVTKRSPTLLLTASPSSPQAYPGDVTLTAELTNYYGPVSGMSVIFRQNGSSISSASVDASGKATFVVNSPSPSASYTYTAQFAGDTDNNSANSNTINYTVSKGTQAALSIADPGAKTYGDADFTLSVSGGTGTGGLSYGSDNTSVATVDASGKVTIKGAGSAVITVTKAADSNYNSASQTVTVTVGQKTLNVTLTPSNKVYDRGTTATLSSASYDTFAYTDSSATVYVSGGTLSFASATAGTGKTVTATGYALAGAKAANYTLGTITVNTADITAKALTVTNTAVADKIYDGDDAGSFSGTPTLSGVVSGDTVTLVGGTATFASKDYSASAITVTLSGFALGDADKDNYSLTQPAAVTAHIGKRTLNVTASPVAIKCGQAVPAPQVQVTGFATGETESNVSGFAKPSASIAYGATTTAVADAPVTVTYTGGTATNNYSFSYDNATTLTIEAVSVTDGDYTVSPAANASGWNSTDLTIAPAGSNGYDQISPDASDWQPTLTVSTEADGGSVTFYLKKSSDGLQTTSKAIAYSLDKTAPTDMTIHMSTNTFTDFLHTITFGLFFGNTVDVELSAFDALSGLDHYEYQLIDTSLGQTYEEAGTWTSSADGKFSISPQFKGALYVRAADKAGNLSDVIQSDGFVADAEVPTAPTVAGTAGGAAYTGGWVANDVTLLASGSTALSGIAYYEYKIGDGGTWTKLPVQSGAIDSLSGEKINDTLTLHDDSNVAVHIRAISNSAIAGSETVVAVRIDTAAPGLLNVQVGDTPYNGAVREVTYGQFLKDSVDLTFSASDPGGVIDHYEYQLVDLSKGQSYDASGTWQSSAGTLTVSAPFKGILCGRAVDKAGNRSSVVQTGGFVVEKTTTLPTAPTVTATVGGKAYDGAWTTGDVKLVASGATALSGVAYYEYRIGDTGTWKKMTAQSGATDIITGAKLYDTLTITADMDNTVQIRAVSNAAVAGAQRATTVRRDTQAPSPKVQTTGTVGQWTRSPVTFQLSDTTGGLSPVTWWVKIGSGEWVQITGSSYTVDTTSDTTYQFKVVSASGLETILDTVYPVRMASDALNTVLDNINSLPDPDTATDKQVTDNTQKIKDTKILYDSLSASEKAAVSADKVDRLNKLLYRLNALLVIKPKDEYTGITADNLGTSVQLPELNDPNVGKVVVQLNVNPVPTTGATQANLLVAADSLEGDGQTLVAAYDVSLFKSVLDAAGAQISSGKISNDNILAPITVRIPVPSQYTQRKDLQVIYIDDNGNVTKLKTTIVTIDGIKYLQFETNHFSMYAVTLTNGNSSPDDEPDTGDHLVSHLLLWIGAGCLALLALTAGATLWAQKNKRQHRIKRARH